MTDYTHTTSNTLKVFFSSVHTDNSSNEKVDKTKELRGISYNKYKNST